MLSYWAPGLKMSLIKLGNSLSEKDTSTNSYSQETMMVLELILTAPGTFFLNRPYSYSRY